MKERVYTVVVNQTQTPISVRLKRAREFLGLSQREFAKELGVTNGAIGLWEADKRVVPGPVVRLLEIYESEMGFAPDSPNKANAELESILKNRISRNLRYLRISSSSLSKFFSNYIVNLLSEEKSPAKKLALLAFANQISAELGKMKGLPMKIGQMMGVLDLGLPDDVRMAFAQLQNSSTPMSEKLVNRVFKEERGVSPREYFSQWSATALSAASIGQVHLARLRTGESVAVKVQYPNIQETFKNDLKNWSSLNKFNRYLFLEQNEGDLVQEMQERLLEECDYLIEARNQNLYRERFLNKERVKVPRVFEQHSTSRILVSEYSLGNSFSEFIREASAEERNHAAETIWQVSFESWVFHRQVHADPHPGNFLFEEGSVTFLDFGCIKTIPFNTYVAWKEFFKAMLDHRFDQAIDQLEPMGICAKKGQFDRSQFMRVMKLIYDPYLKNKVYTFSEKQVRESITEWFVSGPKAHLSVSKDWIFLMRNVWGVSSLMAKMGATANWQEKMLALLYSDHNTTSATETALLPRALPRQV